MLDSSHAGDVIFKLVVFSKNDLLAWAGTVIKPMISMVGGVLSTE